MNEKKENWKKRVLIISTLVGAAAGFAAGYVLSQNADQGDGGPPKIKTSEILRLSVGIIGLVRGIGALGEPD